MGANEPVSTFVPVLRIQVVARFDSPPSLAQLFQARLRPPATAEVAAQSIVASTHVPKTIRCIRRALRSGVPDRASRGQPVSIAYRGAGLDERISGHTGVAGPRRDALRPNLVERFAGALI